VAVNLLVSDPQLTLDGAIRMVLEHGSGLWDDVSRSMVAPFAVASALQKLVPAPILGGDVRVYHATDAATAQLLLRRGFIPETKPHATSAEFEYAPGRGLDEGLYVGETPGAVEGYGRAVLELRVPKGLLEVPKEQVQRGETSALRALRSHDGAVIRTRLPANVFRLMGAGDKGRVRR
jgi:hypothetical protein